MNNFQLTTDKGEPWVELENTRVAERFYIAAGRRNGCCVLMDDPRTHRVRENAHIE